MRIPGTGEQRVAVVSALAALGVATVSLAAVTWAAVADEATSAPRPVARPAAVAYAPADVDADDLALDLMDSVDERIGTAFMLIDAGDAATASALLATLADDVDLMVGLSDRSASSRVRQALARFLAAQRPARATLTSLRLPGDGVAALRASLDRLAAVVALPNPSVPLRPTPAPAAAPSKPAATPPALGATVPSPPAVPSTPDLPSAPAVPGAPVPVPTAVPSGLPLPIDVTWPPAPRPLPTLLPL